MGLFGFGRRPRQPGEPPPWFSPAYAFHMTEANWHEFYAMLTGYLCECCTERELAFYEQVRRAALDGLIGGPNDGAEGAAA